MLDITTTNLGSDDISEKVLSSLQRWAALLSLSLQFAQWKEKQLEKLSTNLEPRENSLLRELKNEKIPLRQLFTSTTELLILSLYFSVIFFKDRWWREKLLACLFFKKVLIVWFDSSAEVQIWCLLLSFWRCKCIGIKPAMVSISNVREV